MALALPSPEGYHCRSPQILTLIQTGAPPWGRLAQAKITYPGHEPTSEGGQLGMCEASKKMIGGQIPLGAKFARGPASPAGGGRRGSVPPLEKRALAKMPHLDYGSNSGGGG